MISGAGDPKDQEAVFTRRAISRWGRRVASLGMAAAAFYLLAGFVVFSIDTWVRLLCALLLGCSSAFLWMASPRGIQIRMDARGLTEVYELGQRRSVIWSQISKVEEIIKNNQMAIALDIYIERDGSPALLFVIDRGYFRYPYTVQDVKRELRRWLPAMCPWFEETYVPRWWSA